MESEKTDIFIVIILGTLVLLVIFFFIILFVFIHQKKVLEQKNILSQKESEFQKDILNATLEATEEERRRVSSNLHDDLGMTMQLLFRKVEKIASEPDREKAKKELFPESKALINEGIQIIRDVTNDLRSMGLEKYGFNFAMESLCESVNNAGDVEMNYNSDIDQLLLPQRDQVHFFRIIKEVLNNTLKNSGASKIEIHASANEHVTVLISHNGQGVSNAEIEAFTRDSKGLGLKSIVARSQLIGATVNYDPKGTISISV